MSKKRTRKTDRRRLDDGKAAEKLAKGATLANIARAAGSKAKRPDVAGAKIVRRLRDRGELQDAFARHGVTIDTVAKNIADRLTQPTVKLHYAGGKDGEGWTESPKHHDPAVQAQAVEQWARLVGVSQVKLVIEDNRDPLDNADAELLQRVADGTATPEEMQKFGQLLQGGA